MTLPQNLKTDFKIRDIDVERIGGIVKDISLPPLVWELVTLEMMEKWKFHHMMQTRSVISLFTILKVKCS